MIFFFQILVSGIAVGGVYALVGLGLVLIYKSTGVLNIAQGAVVMMMAFITYCLSVQAELPFLLAILISLLLAMLLGFLVERLCLRPMIGQPLFSTIMMTIGIMLILQSIPVMIWGTSLKAYPKFLPDQSYNIGGVLISPDYLWGFVISLALFSAFVLYFRYSRAGIVMRAVADHQMAAQSMGVNISRVSGFAWAFSCLVASVGGVVLATITSVGIFLSPIGLKAWPAVIIGGLDSIPGALIGGIIVGVLEGMSGGYLENVFIGIKDVAPYVILLVILLIKPYGLFGLKRIERI
ncbi:MAG: branched-chain amino acid ABC transporter permease [Deltaproteobacteria bacterium]|nr:branched-chain amino acid ABC transporter permease [Deltaproteobacteria bacterium]